MIARSWVVAVLGVLVALGCGRRGFDPGLDAAFDAGPDARTVQLSAHGDHSCARFGDATVRCWGADEFGQLGDGTATTEGGAPVTVAMPPAVAVSTGEFNSFAITLAGAVLSWGADERHQLGDGVTRGLAYSAMPGPVASLVGVVQVAAGAVHACALDDGGVVWCWADENCGQVGDPATTGSRVPAAVAGLPEIHAIAVHDLQSCAVGPANELWCWGAPLSPCTAAVQIPALFPVPRPIVQIEGGAHQHMCAVLDDSAVSCWGDNGYGQLGDGTATDSAAPVTVSGSLRVLEIAVGAAHTCARLADGVACWGDNSAGQLGVGDNAVLSSTVPRTVPFFDGMAIDDIEAGGSHSCARRGATVWCWGENKERQLADGTIDPKFAPVELQLDPP